MHFHTIIDLSVPDLDKYMTQLSAWQTTRLMDHVIQEKHQKLLVLLVGQTAPFSLSFPKNDAKVCDVRPVSCCKPIFTRGPTSRGGGDEEQLPRRDLSPAVRDGYRRSPPPRRRAHTQRCEVERAASYSPHPLT